MTAKRATIRDDNRRYCCQITEEMIKKLDRKKRKSNHGLVLVHQSLHVQGDHGGRRVGLGCQSKINIHMGEETTYHEEWPVSRKRSTFLQSLYGVLITQPSGGKYLKHIVCLPLAPASGSACLSVGAGLLLKVSLRAAEMRWFFVPGKWGSAVSHLLQPSNEQSLQSLLRWLLLKRRGDIPVEIHDPIT